MVQIIDRLMTRFALLWRLVKDVLKAYAGIGEHTTRKDTLEKLGDIASSTSLYFFHYYWRATAFFTITVTMWAHEVSLVSTFLMGFILNITPAIYFITHHRVSGRDITLGQNVRKALDVLERKNRFFWGIALIAILAKVTVMDSPEKVIMIFRKELRGGLRLGSTLALQTAIQTGLWQTFIYLGFQAANNVTHIVLAITIWYALAIKQFFNEESWGMN